MFSDYNKTSDGWLEWKRNQYYISKMSLAVEDARNFCKQRHGDLVNIISGAENGFLWNQVSGVIFARLNNKSKNNYYLKTMGV